MAGSTATALAHLTAELQNRFPALLTFLANGLGEETITSRLAQLPRSPAREVATTYAWRNGLVAISPVAVELFPNAVMLSLDEALADYTRFMADPAEARLWQADWFPLFTNRGIGGEYYVTCLPRRPRSRAPVFWTSWYDFAEEGLRWYQAYDSLTSLLQTVTAAWAQGVYQPENRFSVTVTDTRRLGRLFRQYNPDTVALDVAHATNSGTVDDLVEVYFDMVNVPFNQDPADRIGSAVRAIWAVQNAAMTQHVVRCLASDVPLIRGHAAGLLGVMGAIEAVPALIGLLGDPDPWVARSALVALGGLGDSRALAPVLDLLPQSATSWRQDLLRCLGQLARRHDIDPDAVSRVLAILETDGNPDVQLQAIKTLHAFGDLLAVPILVRLSRTSDHAAVRGQALWTAGLLGGTAMEQTVAAATGDPDQEVRATAAKLLDHFQALRAEG